MSKKRKHEPPRFGPGEELIIKLVMEANHRSRLPRFITLITGESAHHDICHDDILFAFWNGNVTAFVLRGKRLHSYHLNCSLNETEKLLADSYFIRVNDSHLVNRLNVRRVEWGEKATIHLADEYEVKFTDTYRADVELALKEFMP